LAADFVSRFERQRFVLDHLGKPEIRTGKTEPWERDLRRLAAFPNVFCKLSGLVTEAAWRTWTPDDIRPYLDIAFDCFGWNRLMIGSDWPVCTVAGEYSRTMALVTGYLAGRPSHERDAVLGGNAGRFWKIPEQARMRIPQEQLPC
jgi:L-fuconolactonase